MQEQNKDFREFRKQETKEAKKFWSRVSSLDFPELFNEKPKETKIKEPKEIHAIEAKSGFLCADCGHEESLHEKPKIFTVYVRGKLDMENERGELTWNTKEIIVNCLKYGIIYMQSENVCKCKGYRLKDLQNVVFDKNGNKRIE